MSFKLNISLIALIFANVIPLIGALFFNWDAVFILALFWIENLIIGGFNVLKMLSASAYHRELKGIVITAFFIFHYGAFCSIHGSILWSILGLERIDTAIYFASESMGVLELFTEGAAVLLAFIDKFQPQIYLGIAALVLSHLVSFIEHFILRGKIFETKAKDLMAKPYTQIIILHAGLIFGAAAVEKFGSTFWLLLVIIAFKIVVDVTLYRRRNNTKLASETLKSQV